MIDDGLKEKRVPAFRREAFVGRSVRATRTAAMGAAEVIGQQRSSASTVPDNLLLLGELLATQQFPHLATVLAGFGAFSFIRRDHWLTYELVNRRGATASGDAGTGPELLSIVVQSTRRHGVRTLYNAFVREQGRISATTIPDAWLGWIDRIVEFEIAEIEGKWSVLQAAGRLPCPFGLAELKDPPTLQPDEGVAHWCKMLRRELTQLKLRLLRGKLEYGTCAETAAQEIADIVATDRPTAADIKSSIHASEPQHPDKMLDAWRRTETFYNSEGGDSEDKVSLLRCWCEFARAAGGQGDVAVTQSILLALRGLLFDPKRRPRAGSHRKLRRVTYDVLKVDSDLQLHAVAMWRYFDNAPLPDKDWPDRQEHFREVERGTHETEDVVRTTAESAVEYALGRAHSLTVRGRALYLRDQFREAHRVLTLSLSDVGDHLDHERFVRAIAHLFRADLLAISADVHLRQSADVLSSVRKVETAVEMLDSAARWLEPAANRPMWWLHLYIGRAQVRHEQLLMEVRRLAEGKAPLSWTYAQRSLWLEQCVLDALRALRQALDTLPFVIPRADPPSPMVRLEEKVLSLWVQLFVAAFGYNHLLLTRMQIGLLGGRQRIPTEWGEYYVRTGRMIDNLKPLSDLIKPQGFWDHKWRAWCSLCQFYHFATDPCEIARTVDTEFAKGAVTGEVLERRPELRTFREDLLDIEVRLIETNRLQTCLWHQRRKVIDGRG